MQPFNSSLGWLLLAASASFGIADAEARPTSGVLEVDQIFPRNETYAPTEFFPFIFAFQNSALAPFVNPFIAVTALNASDGFESVVGDFYDLRQVNISDHDPYFQWQIYGQFQAEGKYTLRWTLHWSHCTVDSLASIDNKATKNATTQLITFTIAKGGQRLTW
ncbi:hypothetical protein PG999_001540 [Apiospora kogelbergensis]|uniref:DUF7136 domain-containing protein n=1 Tax=Apiospora kogelbergensis TaxID=1337665 RepID=A0AAW0R5Q7_9PEZI